MTFEEHHISPSSKPDANHARLVLCTINYLVTHASNSIVHYHFNPGPELDLRQYTTEVFQETFYDTSLGLLHQNKVYYRRRNDQVVLKIAKAPEDMGDNIHFITYEVFKDGEADTRVNDYNVLAQDLEVVADFTCTRTKITEYLYFDTISWKNYSYTVGTVEINFFNLSVALNIVRCFAGYYDSKLFHYWRIEKPEWVPEVPLSTTSIQIATLIEQAGSVCKNLTEDQKWEFLVYLNSVSCQAMLDSSPLTSSSNNACVDINFMSQRLCSVRTSTSCELAKIYGALKSIYLVPVFEERFRVKQEFEVNGTLELLQSKKDHGTRYYEIDIGSNW